jgi:aspartate/methionine/tyrosine aminotransferase
MKFQNRFQNFDLEYFQSLYERTVEINLADSSVQCANVSDLLAGEDSRPLLELPLYYPEVNGTGLLRERIAALYSSASAENVLVTVGAAQANWMVCSTLLEEGDEVIVISPGYRQVWGLAKNLCCHVKESPLCPGNGWRLDLDLLESLVTAKTKLVSIVNPNNPTGSILSRADMLRIVNICQKAGAWLHADEVYRGTEINDTGMNGGETPSFWGMYDRAICVNSMSKAYGLAGLRIGWVVATPKMIEELWRRHEYAVIAASGPSMNLAEVAMQPAKREMLLERQRKLSREGHAILGDWVRKQDGKFSVGPAVATSIAFVQYHFDVPSVELANIIREKVSVLVAPGTYLGTENHLRITVGYDPHKVRTALERIGAAVAELVGTAARR